MRSMLAACLASSAGLWKVGRTATMSSSLRRHGGEGGGRGPGVERRRFDAFDVVEVQLGDEGEVVAEIFARAGEVADVVPGGWHLLVVDVAEPAAEDGQPEAVAH